MTFTERLLVLFFLNLLRNGAYGGLLSKKETDQNVKNATKYNGSLYEKNLLSDFEEKNLEQEILKELNHLSFRKQREIFVDLEKQSAKFNTTQKSLVASESEILSPLNLEDLKNIRKTIKASKTSLPAIRSKRTLNLLLNLVARAMGYTLTPSNPDAEWIPRQQPRPSAQPCSTPPPPCSAPAPTSTPPPCGAPAPTSTPPPCGAPAPTSTPPPCGAPAPTSTPPPCGAPAPTSPPPPCSMPPTTPACPGSNALRQPVTVPPNQINANTISYPYRPARTIPLFNFAPLPSGVRVPYPPLLQPPAQQRSPCTPQQPSPSPCSTPAPSPPPCGTTPAPPKPQPCMPPTPSPSPSPCMTPAPQPPPCSTTPRPNPQPCATPAPPSPCTTPPSPSPPPCNPPEAGSKPSKKGSLVLEYDDPVRIEIFSNEKKYLPASGKVYSGESDDRQSDWHSYFFPSNEKSKNKDNDFDEEELQEEHVEEEEEEEDETPGQLHHYEKEDERTSSNSEDEEDESETNLSVVKKPVDQKIRKTQRRKSVTTVGGAKDEKEDSRQNESKENTQKLKKPKKKKWIRIVKKQRRKTKTDSNPLDSFHVYTSDSLPESTRISPKVYRGSMSRPGSRSYDASDSGSQSAENRDDFRKVIISKEQIHSPELEKTYEFSVNPYSYALEPEEARRAKLEKAVEKYVEDYVEKQLGQELIKNTGIPKTTVFEYAPKNGPKIQTITTTVAKTSHSGPASARAPTRPSANTRSNYRNANGKYSHYEAK